MSLKAFHVAFVVVSVLLAGFVAWWAFGHWSHHGGVGYLLAAGGAVGAGVALVVYGVWFARKTRGVSYL